MNYAPTIDMPMGSARTDIVPTQEGVDQIVMTVLTEIRAFQSGGQAYDWDSNLTDAGFTSIEMVKVMLGIESAFDLMIPQEQITAENFSTPSSIATMMRRLLRRC